MNFMLEIIRYGIYTIIATFFINYYAKRKGWVGSYRKIIIVSLIWKTLVLITLILFDFLMQYFRSLGILRLGEIIIISMILTYSCDILFGTLVFNFFYKKKMEESIIISSMIILVEMILDNIIIYPLLLFLSL